jgi:hypothetical protein
MIKLLRFSSATIEFTPIFIDPSDVLAVFVARHDLTKLTVIQLKNNNQYGVTEDAETVARAIRNAVEQGIDIQDDDVENR